MSDSVQAADILNKLKTLKHSKVSLNDPATLRFILSKGSEPMLCTKTMHRGLSCNQYAINKLKFSLSAAIKIQLVACLLPLLVMRSKKLKTDFRKTMRSILIKFLRAVLFVTLGGGLPFIMNCRLSPYIDWTSKYSMRLRFTIVYAFGAPWLLIEPL